MSDELDRRIVRIEERVNRAERDVAALSSKLHLIKDDLSRRIVDINDNLKADAEKIRLDLRERINDLKDDIKEDISEVGDSLDVLGENVNTLSTSVQKLYVSQSGSSVKVNINEKLIWAIVGILISVGLYMAQSILKAAA